MPPGTRHYGIGRKEKGSHSNVNPCSLSSFQRLRLVWGGHPLFMKLYPMSLSDSSEDLSEWSVDSDDNVENEVIDKERYSQLKELYEESQKQLKLSESERQKKNREEFDKWAADSRRNNDEERAFIVFFVFALGIVFGYGLCVIAANGKISRNTTDSPKLYTWMNAEMGGWNKTYAKMENTNMQLFQKIMELENAADRRNVTKKVYDLEQLYWSISKKMQDIVAGNAKTIENYLNKDLDGTEVSIEKEEPVIQEKKEEVKEEKREAEDSPRNLTESETRFMDSIEGVHSLKWNEPYNFSPRSVEITKTDEGFYQAVWTFADEHNHIHIFRPDNITRNGARSYIKDGMLHQDMPNEPNHAKIRANPFSVAFDKLDPPALAVSV